LSLWKLVQWTSCPHSITLWFTYLDHWDISQCAFFQANSIWYILWKLLLKEGGAGVRSSLDLHHHPFVHSLENMRLSWSIPIWFHHHSIFDTWWIDDKPYDLKDDRALITIKLSLAMLHLTQKAHWGLFKEEYISRWKRHDSKFSAKAGEDSVQKQVLEPCWPMLHLISFIPWRPWNQFSILKIPFLMIENEGVLVFIA